MRSTITILLLGLALPAAALADSRTIAVLEYRAGVRAAQELAEGMAQELARLTPHKAIPPSQARVRLGGSLDAEVARCKGDPACISRIGGRLGCDEVILIGVSQLGDLILAIQRIEVETSRVLSRLADSLASRRIRQNDLRVYLRRLLPASDFKRYGEIVVKTDGVGDEVFLDEMPRGKTPLSSPLKVPAPGRYTIRVTRPGHEEFVARLDVLPEAAVEVTPKLSRKTAPTRWYQQWWVWALVGGAVAAGATAGVAVAVTRGQERVPAVIRLSP